MEAICVSLDIGQSKRIAKDQIEDTLGTSKQQLVNALKANPTLGQELRSILEQGLNEKLQSLGIQSIIQVTTEGMEAVVPSHGFSEQHYYIIAVICQTAVIAVNALILGVLFLQNVRAIPSDRFDKVLTSIEVNREQKERQEPCIHTIRKHLESQVNTSVQKSLSSNRLIFQVPITIEGRQNPNQECGLSFPTYICKLQAPSKYASKDSSPSKPKTPPLTSDDERDRGIVLRSGKGHLGHPPEVFHTCSKRCSSPSSEQSDTNPVENEEVVSHQTQREAERQTGSNVHKVQESKQLKSCLKHVKICSLVPTDTDSHGSEVEDTCLRLPRSLTKKTTVFQVPKRPYKRSHFFSPGTSEQSDSDSGGSDGGPKAIHYHNLPQSACSPVRGPGMQELSIPNAQTNHGFDRRPCCAINITKAYLKKDEIREQKSSISGPTTTVLGPCSL
ncbi:hypothetical protein NDU88_006168 [Pleurodeles waltl]|uniref:Cilium assembly protein DZIP1 domain-containing protein n=1 Tax=Pleurodeles waltl TaxID=8319 RepID=A0AAV7NXB7_PLEWA|nr:hypothetical protein NDU88_006168 [Pleurodeles waltl]